MITFKSLIAILAILMVLTGCSSKYSPELAKENGDVVVDYGIVGNVEKLDAFISNIDKNQRAEVKITRFTKEGDPVFIYLKYDAKSIKVNRDSSMDKFGSGNSKSYICSQMKKEVKEKGTNYSLDGCEQSLDGDLLFVPIK